MNNRKHKKTKEAESSGSCLTLEQISANPNARMGYWLKSDGVLFVVGNDWLYGEKRQDNDRVAECAESQRIVSQLKDKTLISTGFGVTKELAIKKALLSAIEQVCGVYNIGKTVVINDELVSDGIEQIRQGGVTSYSILNEAKVSGKEYTVTVEAKVSPEKVLKFVKNKGYDCDFSGETFAVNLALRRLHVSNAAIAMKLTPKQDFDGKWGFVDYDGVWQVTPLYDSVEPFDGEYARAVVDDHHMFIDKDGRWFKERPQNDGADEEDVLLDEPLHRSPLDILMDGFSKASAALHKGLNNLE